MMNSKVPSKRSLRQNPWKDTIVISTECERKRKESSQEKDSISSLNIVNFVSFLLEKYPEAKATEDKHEYYNE